MEATAVHVATGCQSVLSRIWVLSPGTYLELFITSQFELDWVAQAILRRIGQVKNKLALGIRGGVVNWRYLALAVDVLQEDLDTGHRFVSFILSLRT